MAARKNILSLGRKIMTLLFKNNTIKILHRLSIAILMTGTLANNVAAEDAKIKSASFSLKPVYKADEILVTSSDGKKWDAIDAKALKLSATMKVDTKHPGYVDKVGILLGNCNNTGCANNPVMYFTKVSQRDYNFHKIITYPGNKIPLSKTGIAVPGYGDEILNGCNSKLQSNGATKSHSFKKLMTASFSANTRKGKPPIPEVQQGGNPDYNGGDVTRQSQFAVKVICKAYVPPPMKLNSVYFVVYKHQAKGCPQKATIDVQFKTSRAGVIEFNLYRDDGNFQKVTLNAKKDGEFFRAKWEKNYTFNKSVNRKYMIATLKHKYSSKWKSMVVKCGVQNDNPGPGGKTNDPHPTHGKPDDRPDAVVTPKRPKKPGIKVAPLPKLVCLGGKISKNKCFCPARKKKMKFGKNKYRCLNNVLKPKSPKRPFKPGIKVAPLPKIVCLGGKVSRNKCFCPSGFKKKVIGKHAYRCIKRASFNKRKNKKILRKNNVSKHVFAKKLKMKGFRK